MFGSADPSTGKIHLTPRGLSFVLAARPVLDSMADLVRIAVKRYGDTAGQPVIGSAEFEGLLGIDHRRSTLLAFVLLEDRWLFRAAGGTVNEGQLFQVDERAVLRVRDVHTIDEYLDAQAAAWYPDPSKRDTPGPEPALRHGRERALLTASGHPGVHPRTVGWWQRHRTDVGVIAAVASVLAAIAVPLATSGGGSSGVTSRTAGHGGGSTKPGNQPPASASSTPTIANQHGLRPRSEIGDVREGIVVYSDNEGTRANVVDIPIGKRVVVICQTPNYSGITSINAFYLMATPPWRGKFASANQFANGAPVGVQTSADPIDPKVAGCRSG